jgi:RNA polymerase sigma factor (sigma-70 family)
MTEHQRVAVVLVHGFGYRHREVAEILGCTTSTVANHVERAMSKLRSQMGVPEDA